MSKRTGTMGSVALLLVSLFSLPAAAQRGQGQRGQAPAGQGGRGAGVQQRGRVTGATRACQLPPEFPCPEARIVDFKADVASIKPGQSVILTWAAENSDEMSITPDIGAVIARSSVKVTPTATTTYTLSATGSNAETVRRALTVTVEGTTPRVVSDSPVAVSGPAPRQPYGSPSLHGVYLGVAERGITLPRPETSLAPNPTLKPGMESYRVVANPNEVESDCLPAVPPAFGPYYFQIVQTPDLIIMLLENLYVVRIIRLDGQPHQDGLSWMGDSIGHWEGDTLVVDTVGFNTESVVNGFRHSEALHMVERFRRVDANTLEIETKLEDPNVFTGPWGRIQRHQFRPELKKVNEYICAENLKTYEYLVDPKAPIKLPQ